MSAIFTPPHTPRHYGKTVLLRFLRSRLTRAAVAHMTPPAQSLIIMSILFTGGVLGAFFGRVDLTAGALAATFLASGVCWITGHLRPDMWGVLLRATPQSPRTAADTLIQALLPALQEVQARVMAQATTAPFAYVIRFPLPDTHDTTLRPLFPHTPVEADPAVRDALNAALAGFPWRGVLQAHLSPSQLRAALFLAAHHAPTLVVVVPALSAHQVLALRQSPPPPAPRPTLFYRIGRNLRLI